MVTGDAAYIKKINRAFILKEIIKEGFISRADLSKSTALTRATISTQVADLLEEELVVEKQIEHNLVGRRPIMLSLNSEAGYALGIDLDIGKIIITVSDLLGRPVYSDTIQTNSTDYEDILALLIEQIQQCQARFNDRRYGIVGIVIAIHGLVSSNEQIHFIPRLGWLNIDLKKDLEDALGIEIHLENNANLCALAERVFFHHETANLLSASLYSGIGLGMIINNQFFRGNDGFAGEIGHMIIVPEGKPCQCGNRGCWEKYASETSVFEALGLENESADHNYKVIKQQLQDNDPNVLKVMEKFIYHLSIGLNNMINIYNPEVVVLDSELLRIYPNSISAIKQNLNSRISHYQQLCISSLGEKSCVLGACAYAIQGFLGIPDLNLSYNE